MQAVFSKDKQRVKAFRTSLSDARFARYLNAANGLELDAIALYHWNCRLSQALYFPMHMWEVALRNKLNRFLCWKYNNKWPYDNARAVRNLTGNDRTRLAKAKERQERARGAPASTDAIVADLSAGFWVSQLTQSYTIPYVWKHNINRIFPLDTAVDRDTANAICDRLLDVRNRMAHHEPIYHLPLPDIRRELDQMLRGMCEASFAYSQHACTFWPVHDAGPIAIPDLAAQP